MVGIIKGKFIVIIKMNSYFIYKYVYVGILNVIYSFKKFKSWNKCFWINDLKVYFWRCGILYYVIKVWKRYGLDIY